VKCSKNVNAPCQNEATEILRVSQFASGWEEYPRCADHPAADDVAMIERVSPLAEVRIVPVDAEAGK